MSQDSPTVAPVIPAIPRTFSSVLSKVIAETPTKGEKPWKLPASQAVIDEVEKDLASTPPALPASPAKGGGVSFTFDPIARLLNFVSEDKVNVKVEPTTIGFSVSFHF